VPQVALTAGGLSKGVTGGGLPPAVASAVFGVAEAGIALARGEVDAAEFAARSGESTFQAGLGWADEERIGLLAAEAGAAVDTAAVIGAAARARVGLRRTHCGDGRARGRRRAAGRPPPRSRSGLLALTQLGRRFDGVPLFLTGEEFDAWMVDPLTWLSLNPIR
jgi:hypothetical protein